MLSGGVKTAFGGPLLAPLGDDAGGMRLVLKRNRQHLVRGGHFQVEGKTSRILNPRQVLITDMAAVFAQVNSNAITAAGRDDLCCADRIGMLTTAGVRMVAT